MGQPAAKQGDRVTATDQHLVQPPTTSPPSLVPHVFNGVITSQLSPSVRTEGRAAATVGSVASNTPPHIPMGGSFVVPPTNRGTITNGSATVRINGKPAARNTDSALTCADPPNPGGRVIAISTVRMGG
jgi:uncharacterized Zn-binding protein involved in type VI secretion